MSTISKLTAPSQWVRCLFVLLFVVAFLGGVQPGAAQTSAVNSVAKAKVTATTDPLTTMPRLRGTTPLQRKAAAARMALRKAANPAAYATKPIRAGGVHSNAVTGVPGAAGIPLTPGQLYFSSTYSNYALSPLPNVNDGVNCTGANHCGIRKFIDPLSLPPAIAGQLPPNPTPSSLLTGSLAQQIPIAVADKTTFPGADYYEIELVQYTEKLHSDLPATMLRGYRQINTPSHVPSAPQYMGPLIIASSKVPVRVKFVNSLGSVTDTNLGTSGNLFIPEDKSVMGAGQGLARGLASYLDNRATIHLHGGATPWISDGTPHQWTVPKVDAGTTYPRGDSVQFVPDMFFVNGVVVPQ